MSKPAQPATSRDDTPIRLGRARAALVVYRIINGQAHFLLVSSARDPDKLTLPGGKVDPGESPVKAAIRETAEEAGILTDPPHSLGRYLHYKRKRRVYPTQTFIARYARTRSDRESRNRLWLTYEELDSVALALRKPIRKQIRLAVEQLIARRAVA